MRDGASVLIAGYELSGIEGDDVHGFTVTNRALTGNTGLGKKPRDDTWI